MISATQQDRHFTRVMDGHLPKAYRLSMPDNGLQAMGIYRDDELLVVPQRGYSQGDIVAVRIGGKIYVRRYFFDERYIFLETANSHYLRLSIELGAPGTQLLGCVTRVLPATA